MKRFRIFNCCVHYLVITLMGSAFTFSTAWGQSTKGKPIAQKPPFPKVHVSVRNLMSNEALDSVYVSISGKSGYTNKLGQIDFDSIPFNNLVVVTKAGYYAESKKAKAYLIFRLAAREKASTSTLINNGFYSRSAEQFAGAATVVSGDDLRKVHPLNFVDALKYYDPAFVVSRKNENGDNPNVVPEINIRGGYNFPTSATISKQSGITHTGFQLNASEGDYVASAVTHPNQPVVLLNGVQVAWQTVLDLDMNRIDKVTILKDASATAMFGVRGATGVVLVQTKMPQKGVLNIYYTGQLNITTPDISSYNLLDAPRKLELEKAAGMYTNNPSLYENRLYQVNKGVNTDWLSKATQTGIGTKHSIGVDGGDDDINYGINFSYNNMVGAMKGSGRKNTNFDGYISTRIHNIVISNYLAYTQSNSANSPYGSYANYGLQNNYWNPYDSVSGKMVQVLEAYQYQGKLYRYYNPAFNGELSTTDAHEYARYSNITALKWNMGNGFALDGRFSLANQSDEHNTFIPPSHTYFADFSPADFFRRGAYNQTSSSFFSWEGALNLHYTKAINKHRIDGSAGTNLMETKSESSGIQMAGFTSDKMADISFGNAYSTFRPATGKISTRLATLYSNVTYSYDKRYQAELTANMDASSQFGDNERWAPHWSAGVSWNLHNEQFLKNSPFFNLLKLRASVGTLGSQYFQSYLGHTHFNYYTDRQYIPTGSAPSTRGIGLGAYLTGYANNNLEEQKTAKQNIGLDAMLINNRLSVRVDAYRNKSTGLVLPVPVLLSTGLINYSYYENLGAIENKGFEFDLNYAIIHNLKKGLSWTIRFNGLHNVDEMLTTSAYLNSVNIANDQLEVDQTRPQEKYLEGQSLSSIWAVRSLGIDPATGQEKFLKADGTETFVWDAADKVNAGNLSPDWVGSFGTAFTLKNISAGVYFNYQYGAKMYNQTLADRLENADLTYNVDARAAANRWAQPGDVALYKALSLNGLLTSPTFATTRFVEDNNYISCSAITLDYLFSNAIASKIKAKQLKLGFIANNVFSTGSQQYEKGLYYPMQRLYSFSVSASF